MGYRVERFEDTPNPNAIKAVLDRSPGPAPRAYRSREAAAGDPLGEALMGIEGVGNVLIHDGWISVGKTSAAAWGPLKRAIRDVLNSAPEPPNPDEPGGPSPDAPHE